MKQTGSTEGERRHAAHALGKISKHMSLTLSVTRATNNDFLHNDPHKFSCSTHETETPHQASKSLRDCSRLILVPTSSRHPIHGLGRVRGISARQTINTSRLLCLQSPTHGNFMEMEGSKILVDCAVVVLSCCHHDVVVEILEISHRAAR